MTAASEGGGEWERLLAAERRLQALLPGSVLVGGTAAALHAGHRLSVDGDHVLADLRDRFDEVLAALESVEGWQTERIQAPVLILGRLDGFPTGVRQLRRGRALDVEIVAGLRVPTLAEMARVKGWLLLTRNTTRDYLDTVVLLDRLGEGAVTAAFSSFDAVYGRSPDGGAPLEALVSRLSAASPHDRAALDLRGYKGIVPPWDDWTHVTARGRHWAARLSDRVLGE
jgi:hypothetical protein